jgi:hypothetical protein
MSLMKNRSPFLSELSIKKRKSFKALVLFMLIIITAIVFIFVMSRENNSYPVEFNRNFLDSCLQNKGTKEGCRCSLDYLQANYSYAQANRLDEEALKSDNMLPDELVRAFKSCSAN